MVEHWRLNSGSILSDCQLFILLHAIRNEVVGQPHQLQEHQQAKLLISYMYVAKLCRVDNVKMKM